VRGEVEEIVLIIKKDYSLEIRAELEENLNRQGYNRASVPVDEINAVYDKNKEAVFDKSPWSSA
jgi:hypothetical protein